MSALICLVGLKMDRGQKKFNHGHGLPPIPFPPSFNGKNNISDAEAETESQASQDLDQESKKLRRWILILILIYASFLYIHSFIYVIFD